MRFNPVKSEVSPQQQSKKSDPQDPRFTDPEKTWVSNSSTTYWTGSVGKVPFNFWWKQWSCCHSQAYCAMKRWMDGWIGWISFSCSYVARPIQIILLYSQQCQAFLLCFPLLALLFRRHLPPHLNASGQMSMAPCCTNAAKQRDHGQSGERHFSTCKTCLVSKSNYNQMKERRSYS